GADVRAARRLQLLGDGAFDAGHRLVVPLTDSDEITVDRPPATAVPDFAAAGVAPAEAGGSVAPPSDREALLARAADLAGQASTWLTNGSPVPGGTSAAGAQFRSLAAELGSAVAAAPPGGQPAVNDSLAALQLSMLVDAEALRKPAASDSARRL